MEIHSAFQVTPQEGEKPGAMVAFPYDRELLRRFREAFPRARWRGAENAWFVPGTTAEDRLDVWIATELSNLDLYADAKGRDAFIFDPLESEYLVVGNDLGVRPPYSRTVVEELRATPFARWDPEAKLWRVPFRSYEALRRRWPVIEEAARRNEPEAKKQRREERQPLTEDMLFLLAERRRRRYPVLLEEPPPLGEAVSVFHFGVVLFEAVDMDTLEEIDAMEKLGVYQHVHGSSERYVWGFWRLPTLQETYYTRPARHAVDASVKAEYGWWQPDREERRERFRKLREIERAKMTRDRNKTAPEAAE